MASIDLRDECVKVTSKQLLTMMRYALLEIRASEDITMANKLAGVFHIVPSRLARPRVRENKRKCSSYMMKCCKEPREMT